MFEYIELAKKQAVRLTNYINVHPEIPRSQARIEFFSQPDEVLVSASIVFGLEAFAL